MSYTYKAIRGNSIGKKMMDCLYIHKSSINKLGLDEQQLYFDKVKYIKDFNFDIVKINLKKSEVSFIESPDWDVNPEPSVGDSLCVKNDNSVKYTKGSNLIYHHKWMFVSDDYSGFNVEESKKRSELWMNHPVVLGLKLDKSERFNSKIGRRPYWDEKVCPIINI